MGPFLSLAFSFSLGSAQSSFWADPTSLGPFAILLGLRPPGLFLFFLGPLGPTTFGLFFFGPTPSPGRLLLPSVKPATSFSSPFSLSHSCILPPSCLRLPLPSLVPTPSAAPRAPQPLPLQPKTSEPSSPCPIGHARSSNAMVILAIPAHPKTPGPHLAPSSVATQVAAPSVVLTHSHALSSPRKAPTSMPPRNHARPLAPQRLSSSFLGL